MSNIEQKFLQETYGKLPPMAIDSEYYVLGAILLEGASIMIKLINEGINYTWFYKEEHGVVFDAAKTLFDNNIDIDIISVMKQVENKGVSPMLLAKVSSKIGNASHILTHVRIIKDSFIKRKGIFIANTINDECYSDNNLSDIMTIINKENEEINNLYGGKSQSKTLNELVTNSLERAESRAAYYAEHGTIQGIKTRLRNLDSVIYGLQQNRLIIIGGRPGSGKTAFALKLANNVGIENNVLFFSLEMGEDELTDRLVLANTEINPDKYAKGDLTNTDWQDLERSNVILENKLIHIEDSPSVSIDKIKAKSLMYKNKNKCDVIIIDYLQLIDTKTDNKQYNKTNEVGELSRKCKLLAKELKVPIILLSQLNREVEKRTNKRPFLSDLRESGNIEQDADIVMFCYRPAYYDITTDENGFDYPENYFELIVAKNRGGIVGGVRLTHSEGLTDFYEYNEYTETTPPVPNEIDIPLSEIPF